VTDLGVKLRQQGVLPTIEEITVSGFFGIGDSPEAKFVRTGFEWQDRLSYVRGRHSLSMGGTVSRKRADTVNEFQRSGRFVFNGNVTGVAMADFFLGKLGTFNQQTGEFKNFRITHWALFFQDDFKVNRRLTVNLGLRYEPSPPWHDTQNRFERVRIQDFVSGVHSQVFRNAPVGETFFGDPGVPQDGSLADNNNVAPRVGFALDVFGDGKTSLRGGVGLFYDQQLNGNFNNSGVNSTPFSTRISLVEPQGPFSDPYQGRVDPFPAPQPNIDSPFPRPVALNTFEERFTTPLTYNWNLTVERQIASAWMARVAYVGSRVNYGRRNVQLNPARYIPGASTTANTDSRRLFAPEYAPITLFTGSANSSYHSLQASLNKRLARGFTVLANYTFSKSLDNFGASVMPWYFPNGQSMDWGPSTFDHSQRFVLSWVWELPSLKANNVLAKVFVNGWQATGVGQYQTGDPLTIVSGRDNSLTGIGQDRAVFTGLDPGRPAGADRVLQWFNPAAFGQNPSTTFGTVGKGRFRGPSLYSWDMGFFKSFRLKENVGLQFRGELFNIFNQVNLADPSAQVSSGGFGRITSTLAGQGDPRIIQFGLKFAF
jgi:hypothetical protein